MPPGLGRRTLVAIGTVSVAITVVLAIVVGFGIGRRGRVPAPGAQVAGPTAPVVVADVEDAQWFQPDDYLVTAEPLRDGRIDAIHVAKLVQPPDRAQGVARFLDGEGREIVTATYWKSRIARRDDLVIGAPAFCRADTYNLAGAAPRDKAEARTRDWAFARVTDTSELGAGRVTLANVVCEVGGVRVPVLP